MSSLQRTAQLFRSKRRRWISAVEIARVGGFLAWRSRTAECRTVLGMQIENKQERDRFGKVTSWYRYQGRRAS